MPNCSRLFAHRHCVPSRRDLLATISRRCWRQQPDCVVKMVVSRGTRRSGLCAAESSDAAAPGGYSFAAACSFLTASRSQRSTRTMVPDASLRAARACRNQALEPAGKRDGEARMVGRRHRRRPDARSVRSGHRRHDVQRLHPRGCTVDHACTDRRWRGGSAKRPIVATRPPPRTGAAASRRSRPHGCWHPSRST
jgi:hypothetical protein